MLCQGVYASSGYYPKSGFLKLEMCYQRKQVLLRPNADNYCFQHQTSRTIILPNDSSRCISSCKLQQILTKAKSGSITQSSCLSVYKLPRGSCGVRMSQFVFISITCLHYQHFFSLRHFHRFSHPGQNFILSLNVDIPAFIANPHSFNMVQLLSLADSVLQNIMKYTCPHSIGQLVLSCKKLYKVGSNLLAQHKHNKSKYAALRWPLTSKWNPDDFDPMLAAHSNPACLSDLLFEPRLAPYGKRLDYLTYSENKLRTRGKPFPTLPLATQDPILQRLFNVAECPYVPQAAQRL